VFLRLLLIFFLSSLYSWEKEFLSKVADSQFVDSWISEQIEEDFLGIDYFATLEQYDLVQEELMGDNIALYEIKGQQLTVRESSYHKDKARNLRMREVFEELLTLVSLPDVSFFINFEDVPRASQHTAMFCFSKEKGQTRLILIPDPEAFGIKNSCSTLLEKATIPWENKLKSAFWRGETVGSEYSLDNFLQLPRSSIVALSLIHPNLINARFIGPPVSTSNPSKVAKIFNQFFDAKADHWKDKIPKYK
jgi:hypothetical protein